MRSRKRYEEEEKEREGKIGGRGRQRRKREGRGEDDDENGERGKSVENKEMSTFYTLINEYCYLCITLIADMSQDSFSL